MLRPHALTLFIALTCPLALAGCSSGAGQCGAPAEKSQVLATAQDWYLWNTELPDPATLDPTLSPSALLDALTAQPRAEGKDRFFSYLTTVSASSAFFGEGKNLGYGFGIDTRGSRLFVEQTFPGSAVATAGLQRGDELLAIAASAAALDDPASQAAAIIADGALHPGALSAALNSGVAATRFFRVLEAGATASVDLAMTSSIYSLDPVPGSAAPIILTSGAHTVGYVQLRTFITPAEALLHTAFAGLKAAHVTDLIVDLRYNGGGLVDTAIVLGDLLGAARAPTDLMFELRHNAIHAGADSQVDFGAASDALAPDRVAFIVRGGTASASELVINALQPYLAPAGGPRNLAIVGDRTYGKPVGQQLFANSACDMLLALIAVQLFNRDGTGSYFHGLPDADFHGDACLAADDLAHPMGDAAEASTAAALQWIADGTCAAGPIAASSPALLARREAERAAFEAQQPGPTLAQRHIPGLF